jgi:hypothetical protein
MDFLFKSLKATLKINRYYLKYEKILNLRVYLILLNEGHSLIIVKFQDFSKIIIILKKKGYYFRIQVKDWQKFKNLCCCRIKLLSNFKYFIQCVKVEFITVIIISFL